MKFSEDMIFCFKCLCLSRKYLRVPAVTNIHRMGISSVSKRSMTSAEGVRLWLGVATAGIQQFDSFMSEQEFFRRNPDLRHDALKFFVDKHFGMIKDLFTVPKPYEVPQIFFDELRNPALDSRGKDLVAAYLFAERALTR